MGGCFGVQRVNLDKAEAWRPRRIADVVYALGLSHHWTSRLPELEALLVKCGGLAALTARESASIMWGLATLGHSPSGAPPPPHPCALHSFHRTPRQQTRIEGHGGMDVKGTFYSSALPSLGSIHTGTAASYAFTHMGFAREEMRLCRCGVCAIHSLQSLVMYDRVRLGSEGHGHVQCTCPPASRSQCEDIGL